MNNPRRKILLLSVSIVAVVGFSALRYVSKNEEKDVEKKPEVSILEETEERIQQFEIQAAILMKLRGQLPEIQRHFPYIRSLEYQARLALAESHFTFARVLQAGGKISKENSQALDDLGQRYKKTIKIIMKLLADEIKKIREEEIKQKEA